MKVKLPFPVYGCVSVPIGETLILVCGGYNPELKCNTNQAITICLETGNIIPLEDLPFPGSSVLPIFFNRDGLHLFFQGEETKKLPDHVAYYLNIPG